MNQPRCNKSHQSAVLDYSDFEFDSKVQRIMRRLQTAFLMISRHFGNLFRLYYVHRYHSFVACSAITLSNVNDCCKPIPFPSGYSERKMVEVFDKMFVDLKTLLLMMRTACLQQVLYVHIFCYHTVPYLILKNHIPFSSSSNTSFHVTSIDLEQ